jgi:hypothetical protein
MELSSGRFQAMAIKSRARTVITVTARGGERGYDQPRISGGRPNLSRLPKLKHHATNR